MDIGKTNLIVILYIKVCKKKKIYFVPIIFFVSFFLLALPSYFLGTFYPGTKQQGLIEDFGALFGVGLLGFPFLAFFSIYFINNVPKILISLKDDSNIEIPKEDFEKIQTKFIKRVTRKLNNLVLLLALFLNGIWVAVHLTDPTLSWFTTFNSNGQEILMLNGYFYILVMTAFFYILCYILIYFISVILLLKELSKKARIRVNPLHPDRCGGLANIGKLGFINSLPILILAIGIVSILINDTYYMNMELLSFYHIFIISIYLLISPFFFFLPLYFFKIPMQLEKKETLNKLGNLYNQIFRDTFIDKNLDNNSLECLNKLDLVKNSYDQAEKMPIWPFNAELIKNYFLLVYSPFTAIVVPLIIERM